MNSDTNNNTEILQYLHGLPSNTTEDNLSLALVTLDRFGSAPSTPSGLQELLDSTLSDTISIAKGSSGSIMLYEEDGCRVVSTHGLKPGIKKKSRAAKHSVSMRAIASRKPILLQGKVSSGDYPDSAPRPEIVSSMLIPLEGGQGIVGLLSINSTNPERVFNEKDLQFVSSCVARPLAAAVENSRLHEASKEQSRILRNLYEIAKTITSAQQLDEVLEAIINRLRVLIPLDVCSLVLYDNDSGKLKVASSYGLPNGVDSDYSDLIPLSIQPASARTRTVVIDDLTRHPAYSRLSTIGKSGLHSAVIVPLVAKRKRVGFLAVYRRQVQGFSKPVVKLLNGLGEMAAVAIENARLYERQSGIVQMTQRMLTPAALAPIPGFDVGCRYAPAYQIGGDYYDVIKLDENRYGIIIADVSGKDVSAASHIAMCKHSIRAIADLISTPALLLERMNHLIYDNTEANKFISLFYATIDTKSGDLVYASAGHDPCLLLKAGNSQAERLLTGDILLGILPHATFSEVKTSIQIDDTLLMYTDGLIGALSTDYDTGVARMEEALIEWRLKSAQGIADNIYRLATTRNAAGSPDDIAFVVLKGL